MNIEILSKFDALRRIRRRDPLASLQAAGEVVAACLRELASNAEPREIPWKGSGNKTYDVYALPGTDSSFSRSVRRATFLPDPDEFVQQWNQFLAALERSRGKRSLAGVEGTDIDRLFYTAVIGFGATVDLFSPGNRGGPGTFFECLVGPAVAHLSGRPEHGSIKVPLPGTTKKMTVPTDLSFPPLADGGVTLVIPTKISTRERVSQAYVHQRILESDQSGKYRSALCVANENNMGGGRSLATAFLKDTLVPNTIVQYQTFIAELSGFYYLDPPSSYLPPPELFPEVRQFHALLVEDLPELL